MGRMRRGGDEAESLSFVFLNSYWPPV